MLPDQLLLIFNAFNGFSAMQHMWPVQLQLQQFPKVMARLCSIGPHH